MLMPIGCCHSCSSTGLIPFKGVGFRDWLGKPPFQRLHRGAWFEARQREDGSPDFTSLGSTASISIGKPLVRIRHNGSSGHRNPFYHIYLIFRRNPGFTGPFYTDRGQGTISQLRGRRTACRGNTKRTRGKISPQTCAATQGVNSPRTKRGPIKPTR